MLLRSAYRLSVKAKPQAVQKADQYIEEQLRKRDWETHHVGRFLPGQLRSAYYSINMFNNELAKIAENTKEPSLAMGKLEFWRGIINSIYSRQAQTQQPISISLDYACTHHPLTKIYFNQMIQARVFEIHNREINTMEQMFELTENIRGSTILLTLELLRANITPEVKEVAMLAGRAIGICDYIKRIPYGLRNYRLYMPTEITAKYNLTVRTLWDRIHGIPREELYDVVLEVASYARQAMLEAKNKQSCLQKEAFRAFLPLVDTELYLEKLQKYNFKVFDKALYSPSTFVLPRRLFTAARNKTITYA